MHGYYVVVEGVNCRIMMTSLLKLTISRDFKGEMCIMMPKNASICAHMCELSRIPYLALDSISSCEITVKWTSS